MRNARTAALLAAALGLAGAACGGSSDGVGLAGGAAQACRVPEDCPAPSAPCLARICESGACGTADAREGTAALDPTPGDCQRLVCDGRGATRSEVDPDDVPDDGDACTLGRCVAGAPEEAPLTGTPCDAAGGLVCSEGACVECVAASDCASLVCAANHCQAPTCEDGVKNGLETGLDCGGGRCGACADGQGCASAADCQSGVCEGACQAPRCDDGTRNGAESDVDCGGTCAGCSTGKKCVAGADCESHHCSGGFCFGPSCSDGLLNGHETDVDCGGPLCAPCAAGAACAGPSDCLSGLCELGYCHSP